MVLRSAALTLVLLAVPADAASRGTLIAMAVGLLDVVEEHCVTEVTVDPAEKKRLLRDFREYDIGGIASAISGPLNAFYEDFLHEVKSDRLAFCAKAPGHAAHTGYPVLVAAEGR